MNWREVISRKIRENKEGVNVAGDVNAVVNANVGEKGKSSHTSVSSKHRIVQRGGRTVVDEHETVTSTDPRRPARQRDSEGR